MGACYSKNKAVTKPEKFLKRSKPCCQFKIRYSLHMLPIGDFILRRKACKDFKGLVNSKYGKMLRIIPNFRNHTAISSCAHPEQSAKNLHL